MGSGQPVEDPPNGLARRSDRPSRGSHLPVYETDPPIEDPVNGLRQLDFRTLSGRPTSRGYGNRPSQLVFLRGIDRPARSNMYRKHQLSLRQQRLPLKKGGKWNVREVECYNCK